MRPIVVAAVVALLVQPVAADRQARVRPASQLVPLGERWYCFKGQVDDGSWLGGCERASAKCFEHVLWATNDGAQISVPMCDEFARAAAVTYHRVLKDEFEVEAFGDVELCEAKRASLLADANYDAVSKCTITGARLAPKLRAKATRAYVGPWWCTDGVDGWMEGPDGTKFFAHAPGRCEPTANDDGIAGAGACNATAQMVQSDVATQWSTQVTLNTMTFDIGRKPSQAWLDQNAPVTKCKAQNSAWVFSIEFGKTLITQALPTREDCNDQRGGLDGAASRCTEVTLAPSKKNTKVQMDDVEIGIEPCDQIAQSVLACARLPAAVRKVSQESFRSWAKMASEGKIDRLWCEREQSYFAETLAYLGCAEQSEVTALPEQPTSSDVKSGIGRVRDGVHACGDNADAIGTVTVKIQIGPEGGVASASATGATEAVRECVVRQVQMATFPKSQRGLSVNYPFVFK